MGQRVVHAQAHLQILESKFTMGQGKTGRTVSMQHEGSGGRPYTLPCSQLGLLWLLLLLLGFILMLYLISLQSNRFLYSVFIHT